MKYIADNLIEPEIFKSCLYCGSTADTKDHVPPKALLEKPYPKNCRTVPACKSCNSGFSSDEEYVRNAISHVGFTDILRAKCENGVTYRALQRSQKHQMEFEKSHVPMNDGSIHFIPNVECFEKVVLKIAKGLFLIHYNRYPDNIIFDVAHLEHVEKLSSTLKQLTYKKRVCKPENLWPEVGSLCLERAVSRSQSLKPPSLRLWESVQSDIFEYMFRPDPDDSKYRFLLMKFHETVWAAVQFNKPRNK